MLVTRRQIQVVELLVGCLGRLLCKNNTIL